MAIEHRITELFKTNPTCRRLATVPGVGPLIATALLGSVPDPNRFNNGRQFAAYLGLVPGQHSTGGKSKLLGISKAGDSYLRTLLIHGARSVILQAGKRQDRRSRWIKQIVERRGLPKANVALANKNARVLWRILTSPDATFIEELAA